MLISTLNFKFMLVFLVDNLFIYRTCTRDSNIVARRYRYLYISVSSQLIMYP